jgi:hypothetical protein
MALRQKYGAGAEMVAADLGRGKRFRHAHVGVAHDREVIAERFERRQGGRRQIELAPGSRRAPEVLLRAPRVRTGGAVHDLDADEPCACGRSRRSPRRWKHGVQEWQRQHRSAGVAKEGAARNVLAGDELHWLLQLL